MFLSAREPVTLASKTDEGTPHVNSQPSTTRQRPSSHWHGQFQKDIEESGFRSYKAANYSERSSDAHWHVEWTRSDRPGTSWAQSPPSQLDFDEDVESVALGENHCDKNSTKYLNCSHPMKDYAHDEGRTKRALTSRPKSEKKAASTIDGPQRKVNWKAAIFKIPLKFRRKASKKEDNDEAVETNSNVSAGSSDNDGKLSSVQKSSMRNRSNQRSTKKRRSSKATMDTRTKSGNPDNVEISSHGYKQLKKDKSKSSHNDVDKSPKDNVDRRFTNEKSLRSVLTTDQRQADMSRHGHSFHRQSNNGPEVSADRVGPTSSHRRQRHTENGDDVYHQEAAATSDGNPSRKSREHRVVISTAPPSTQLRNVHSVEFNDESRKNTYELKSERRRIAKETSTLGKLASSRLDDDRSSLSTEDTSGTEGFEEVDDVRKHRADRTVDFKKSELSTRRRRLKRRVGSRSRRLHQSDLSDQSDQSDSDESDTESSRTGNSSSSAAVSQIVVEENEEHSKYIPLFGVQL